jgi:hypothetical protein
MQASVARERSVARVARMRGMSRGARVLLAGTLALAAACSRASSVPPPAADTTHAMAPVVTADAGSAATAKPTMAIAFCGFGGQGVLGAGARWEDFIRVVVVVDVDSSGVAALHGVTLSSIAMVNDEGAVEASMRSPIHVDRVEPIPEATTWETALRPGTRPFDGTLTPGRTRLRVEAWLTTHPRRPVRVHVVLDSPAGPVEAHAAINGEWPTG